MKEGASTAIWNSEQAISGAHVPTSSLELVLLDLGQYPAGQPT